MIIDGHAHAVREFADPEQLVRLLDRCGVDRVALCPGLKNNRDLRNPPNIPTAAVKQHPLYSRFFIQPGIRFAYNYVIKDQGDGNEFVHSLAQKCPDRIVQVYWPDPRKPGFISQLENDLERWDIRAIKLHQSCTPFRNDGAEINQIAQFAGEKQLPIIIHLWSKNEARRLITLAKNHPETRFIILHTMFVETFAEHARNLSNIYIDTSPYSYVRESRIKLAVEIFGADHVVFGSDTPFDKDALSNNLERIKNMDLSHVQREQILGRNIAEILKL